MGQNTKSLASESRLRRGGETSEISSARVRPRQTFRGLPTKGESRVWVLAASWHGGENAVPACMVVGIYNASGTVWGEATYVLRKLVGRGSCALCDITHGWSPVMRADFKQACDGRAWDLELLHTDEASADQLAAAGPLPAVVRKTADGWVRVLGPADFALFGRSSDALLDAIEGQCVGPTSANGIDSSS